MSAANAIYLVAKRAPGDRTTTDRIRAEQISLHDSGALLFMRKGGLVAGYGRDAWLSVVVDES